jgi:hypothetical protein
MFEAFGRSKRMFTESLAVIRRDKALLAFPVMSAMFTVAALVAFVFGAYFAGFFVVTDAGHHGAEVQANVNAVLGYALLFVWYFVSWTIVLFFNVALIHCAKLHFDGQPVTASDGLKCAMSHLPRILAWAAVSATVGVVLQAIADKNKIVGGIVKWLVGAVWAVATFFIVPVMIYENLSLYASFKRSIELIAKSWGEAAIGNVGVGYFMLLLALPAIIIAIVIAAVVPTVGIFVGGGLLVAYMAFLCVLSSAITGVMRAALYNYASTGVVPSGMSQDVFALAFKAKTKK